MLRNRSCSPLHGAINSVVLLTYASALAGSCRLSGALARADALRLLERLRIWACLLCMVICGGLRPNPACCALPVPSPRHAIHAAL